MFATYQSMVLYIPTLVGKELGVGKIIPSRSILSIVVVL